MSFSHETLTRQYTCANRFLRYSLAWKFALGSKGLASPALLDSYEAQRMPATARMLNISTILFGNITGTVSAKTPAPQAPSAAALQAVKEAQKQNENESTWAKRRQLFQLDINYRWSGGVVDERYADEGEEKGGAVEAYDEEGRTARVGDHAPDAPALKRIGGSGIAPTRFLIYSLLRHTPCWSPLRKLWARRKSNSCSHPSRRSGT